MKLHVYPPSPNARKVMVVNEHLGCGAEIQTIDLLAGEQRQDAFLALNPNGRIPVLEFDDGTTLWESNAIMNRLASDSDNHLWPRDNSRYDIMRWQFWEGCHWTPAAGKFIAKHLFKDDSVDLDKAEVEFRRFAEVLEARLAGRDWLVGDAMTNADLSVSAIMCYREQSAMPVGEYANILRWLAAVEAVPAWQSANARA